jgi:hypothetical protein
MKRRGASRAVRCQPIISCTAGMVCFDHFSIFQQVILATQMALFGQCPNSNEEKGLQGTKCASLSYQRLEARLRQSCRYRFDRQ